MPHSNLLVHDAAHDPLWERLTALEARVTVLEEARAGAENR